MTATKIAEVAAKLGLTEQQVAEIHASASDLEVTSEGDGTVASRDLHSPDRIAQRRRELAEERAALNAQLAEPEVDDEPDAMTASEYARSICPPQDKQAAQPRSRSAKPGTAIQRAIAAYRNRQVLTVDGFMKSLGADGDTIRRYRGSLGRKVAQAYRAATASEPVRSGWAVAHHRLIPVYAYSRDQADLLATVARAYKPTAALAEVA